MRRLNTAMNGGGPPVERRKNRRIAYFRGKYNKETAMLLLIFVVCTMVFYRLNS